MRHPGRHSRGRLPPGGLCYDTTSLTREEGGAAHEAELLSRTPGVTDTSCQPTGWYHLLTGAWWGPDLMDSLPLGSPRREDNVKHERNKTGDHPAYISAADGPTTPTVSSCSTCEQETGSDTLELVREQGGVAGSRRTVRAGPLPLPLLSGK